MKHLLAIILFVTITISGTAEPIEWSGYTQEEKHAFALGILVQSSVIMRHISDEPDVESIIDFIYDSIYRDNEVLNFAEVAAIIDRFQQKIGNEHHPLYLWRAITDDPR